MNIGNLKICGQVFRLIAGKPGQRLATSLQKTGQRIGDVSKEARERAIIYRKSLSNNLGTTGERIGFSLVVLSAGLIPIEIVAENIVCAAEFLEKGPNYD